MVGRLLNTPAPLPSKVKSFCFKEELPKWVSKLSSCWTWKVFFVVNKQLDKNVMNKLYAGCPLWWAPLHSFLITFRERVKYCWADFFRGQHTLGSFLHCSAMSLCANVRLLPMGQCPEARVFVIVCHLSGRDEMILITKEQSLFVSPPSLVMS